MRLRRLHLRAFGPFTDRILDFGDGQTDLILVHGANEAGKSSTLRAISDLRFGIPTQSADNFIHPHPTMRIGGEFMAQDGAQYSLMRRKGRNNPLYHVDFSHADPGMDRPASAQIEALLTGGLTKEQHDSMFGINHQGLREGGRALLSGNGEVGAALFEASAGVRSVPEIMKRLDDSARKFFMPGARAKNGQINEALSDYVQQNSNVRSAQVRPSHWADLSKELDAATEALDTIDRQSRAMHDDLRLIAEIRAVTPLLSTLTAAERLLEELKAVPVLSTTAASERAAAQQGLTDAQSSEKRSNEEANKQRALLETLQVEESILTQDAPIRRLGALIEAMETHEHDKAHADVDVRRLQSILSDLSAQIETTKYPKEIGSTAPLKVERVEMERLLRQAEGVQRSLEGHIATKPDLLSEIERHELPTEGIREDLTAVLAELARSDAHLLRLEALPLEIEAARRVLDRCLAAVALDEARYASVRPLFDAQIDESFNQTRTLETRRDGLDSRISKINDEIDLVARRRDQLLREGTVPTRLEVLNARGVREAAWNRVRQAYIDGDAPASTLIDDKKDLSTEYESTVKQADELIDALASDTKRAAEYTACLDSLNNLQRDRAVIDGELTTIASEALVQSESWTSLLTGQNLPALSPAALREWQARLPAVRAALESVRHMVTEQNRLVALSHELKKKLAAAITAAVGTTCRPEATLSSLVQTAQRAQENWSRIEAAAARADGERKERGALLKKWDRLNDDLTVREREARKQVEGVLRRLSLPLSASYESARARIEEINRIIELRAEIAAAQSVSEKAEVALTTAAASANLIASHLKETRSPDLRHFGSLLLERLDTALETRRRRQLAQQALESAVDNVAVHHAHALKHAETLLRLCDAASVEDPNDLPTVEDQSERKRAAQRTADHARAQLLAASKRSVAELRQLLAVRDLGRLDEDEHARVDERDELDKDVASARERHRLAKAALDKIDSSDVAVVAKEAAEQAAARVRSNMGPWIRSKLAHSLLSESLRRFREAAQGPMLTAASTYFKRMTCGKFERLTSDESDEEAVLIALRATGDRVHVEDMSEGTRDQLYLALRLAALDFRRAGGVDLPVILDDILITSDDERTLAILDALSESAKAHQIMVFTHHNHIVELARHRFKTGIQHVELI